MASGHLVELPGWEALAAMPAEWVKAWLLSKQHEQNYMAVVTTDHSHRGRGAVLPTAQAQQAVGDQLPVQERSDAAALDAMGAFEAPAGMPVP